MAEDKWVYAVTRIHINEMNLLTRRDLEAMASFASVEDALSLLAGKGWDVKAAASGGLEAIIDRELEKTWALIAEAAGNIEELSVLRKPRDFHNLKAAMKLAFLGEPEGGQNLFLPYGTTPLDKIKKAVETRDFSKLPPDLGKAGADAWEILSQTGSGQLCEITLDRASLEASYQDAQSFGSQFLAKWARMAIDAANMKACARASKQGKTKGFFERLVASGGSLDKNSLIQASLSGFHELLSYLSKRGFKAAADALSLSGAAFEKWANDEQMRLIIPMKSRISGIEPLAAFILARESELRQARLILGAKANRLPDSALKERLGLTYV
ncbi:MAG: V-type ATPase subunit [Clostridiales bacterium]|jgi:V/A-type H+-transporting ATPase subunit C|nr:V-type ATPase subunit [Clostridiales bacterium]